MIKVAILTNNCLFCEGIKALLFDSSDIKITNICREGLANISRKKPDILLTDAATLPYIITELKNQPVKVIIVNAKHDRDSLSLFRQKNVAGIMPPDTTPSLLKKAIQVVSHGELWIERKAIKNMLSEVLPSDLSIETKHKAELSKREKEVAKLVCEGKSNKEIAKILRLSEQTIKSHLNRVYKKLGVCNRVTLAMNLRPFLSNI